MDIEGVGALVTGGGSGLGAATARLLAEEGALVTVLDIDLEAAKAVAEEIGGLGLKVDVCDADSAFEATTLASQAHGPARILVNCAGIAPAKKIVGREGAMPLADFEQVIKVNLIGSFNMLRLAAAEMVAAEPLNEDGERGVIVSTASIAAVEGQVGQAAYSASKAGVMGLSLPAAREFAGLGVRVNAIAPGLMETPMLRGLPDKVREGLGQQFVFPKRFGKPEEFARMVRDICANPMINGETLRLDGALRMM